MIFEAISAFNEPNGADTSAIISYIEVPTNFISLKCVFLLYLIVIDLPSRQVFICDMEE
jgi:hypothetical protein